MSLFLPVDNVLAQYHRVHGMVNVPIKIDHLRPILEGLSYVDKMYWEKLDCETEHVAGQVTTYQANMGVYSGDGEYARIQYSRNLNFCWQRFVICKEMYQCVIDKSQEKRIVSTDSLKMLADRLSSHFLEVIADEDDEEDNYPPFETETIAEILALETLFPIELRRCHFDDFDNGVITPHQLALRYRIPEELIVLAMTNASYTSAVLRGRKIVDIKCK